MLDLVKSEGTISELRQRLQVYYLSREGREQSSSVDPEDPKSDVILATQSKVGDLEEVKRRAKSALGKELAKNELNVEEIGGEFYVCNTPGLGLAERVRVIEAKDLQKDKRILLLGKEIKSHKEEITELKGNLTTLKLAGQDDEYASDS